MRQCQTATAKQVRVEAVVAQSSARSAALVDLWLSIAVCGGTCVACVGAFPVKVQSAVSTFSARESLIFVPYSMACAKALPPYR